MQLNMGNSAFCIPSLYTKLFNFILGFSSVVKYGFIIFPWYWGSRLLETIRNKSKGDIQHKQDENSSQDAFLEQYRDSYGYPDGPMSIDELRISEFPRLNGVTYLDHAGATLHSDSQLQAALTDYTAQLYGNPHSQSQSSIRTSEMIESARHQVLAYFRASPSDYACIFTSGATAGLKLVGEAFPWTCNSDFFYTTENHNSVLGIREYALCAGATATAIDVSGQDQNIQKRMAQTREGTRSESRKKDGRLYHLFAMPTECNFSGVKSNLELVKLIQEGKHVDDNSGRWMVLLDAAKSAGTSPPDLSKFSADFLVTSFYKIFGYPTGLGALLVRRDAAKVLNKTYFGGGAISRDNGMHASTVHDDGSGTVAVSIADIDFARKREDLEHWLEDGTVSFLSIAALRHGFAAINRMGINLIARHTWSLTHYTASELHNLKHANGAPVCCIYGNHGISQGFLEMYQVQGPVVTFNLKRADKSWVGHREVEKLATLSHIHLRTGCFCNPGACAKYLGLSNKDMQLNFQAGHVCWDDHDIMSGKPTGAVRISFGYMSTFEDCQSFLRFIRKFFVEERTASRYDQVDQERHMLEHDDVEKSFIPMSLYLKSVTVYPIKSCAGFSVESWPVASSGLLYDREWLIADASNVALTQKKVKPMCLIRPSIDLTSGKLIVQAPNMELALEIPLEGSHSERPSEILLCGERAQSKAYGPDVSEWFTKALGVQCSLIRKEVGNKQVCRWRTPEHETVKERGEDTLSFANEGQFLIVSEASVQDLNMRMRTSSTRSDESDGLTLQLDPMQFRPNFVVSGGAPYEEDKWQMLNICSVQLPVIGGCNRCQMITINQKTGDSDANSEPLITLASYRRTKGKILFGLLLGPPLISEQEAVVNERLITVGSPVLVN